MTGMRKERKEILLHSFPLLPDSIEEQMQGKGALNFCVFLTEGRELFVRCYHRYTNGVLIERQRYVFAKDGAVRYIYDEWRNGEKWSIASKFTEPRFAAKGYPYSFDNTYCILNASAYKRSDVRYSRLDKHNFCCPIMYLRLYVRHPNVEYLLEAGYAHLIEECEDYYGGKITINVNYRVNLKSNNLLKMLGLNRDEFKALSGWEKQYENYLYYRETYPKYKPAELMEIVHAYGYEHGTLESNTAMSGLSPLRLSRYITSSDITPGMYSDYLRQCRELRYDLSDTAVSLPHDFNAMHERLSGIIKYRADEKLRAELEKNYRSRCVIEYDSGELILIQPKSIEEITAEGRALCHCVGGYAERHAKGQTNIMFLRKRSEPGKPYYTMEVSRELKIVQCFGYKNNSANNPKPPEIKAFEREYQNYLEVLKHDKQNQRSA